jgi:hypothetical protein
MSGDVATPRPNEQPALLFEQMKNLSLAVDGRKGSKTVFEEARAKREAAYHLLKEVAQRKGRNGVKAFEASYSVLIAFGGHGKETSKHCIVSVIDLFRKRVLQVAGTFVNTNRLDYPDQIFDLTIDDLDRALVDSSLDLGALAKEHKVPLDRIRRSHLAARCRSGKGIRNSMHLRARRSDRRAEGRPTGRS